jgi:hypothetical protein
MPLPDVCPLDKESSCKYDKCHLYHVDWRTGEENCSIGYRVTSKTRSTHQPPQDNYAENTRKMLGRSLPSRDRKVPERTEAEPAKKEVKVSPPEEESVREEVVCADKDTTVFQSYNGNEGKTGPGRSGRKKIDDAMKLDLPENYEEEFWS